APIHECRETYHPRFSPRFVTGFTQMVRRRVDQASGRVSYNLGGLEPLRLDEVANLLAAERDQAYRAFKAFQALVHEQSDAITRFEGRHKPYSCGTCAYVMMRTTPQLRSERHSPHRCRCRVLAPTGCALAQRSAPAYRTRRSA